jgi:hypothetical protein
MCRPGFAPWANAQSRLAKSVSADVSARYILGAGGSNAPVPGGGMSPSVGLLRTSRIVVNCASAGLRLTDPVELW